MCDKRRVEVSQHGKPNYTGVFGGYGVDYEEFESGPASFTIVIVEKEDGTIDMVHPSMVRFLT